MEAKTTVILIRYKCTDTYTRGWLFVNGKVLHTLERAWKDNKINESCIPDGTYDCTYLPRSYSGKYKEVFHVKDVPNRSGILFHNGNTVNHTRGCILVGNKSGYLGGSPAVLGSRIGMSNLRQELNKQNFKLIVVNIC